VLLGGFDKMIICKKCRKEGVNEGHGLCLRCSSLFRYHRRIHGTTLEEFLLRKRFQKGGGINVRK
tara:strand:+ start:1092 stop:1286 length:195 start_codon:yes stop_codon:yes gene_type:complete